MTRGDWIQTYTGKAFYPLSPLPSEIDRGRLYTVAAIVPADKSEDEDFVVVLREHGFGERVLSRPWWAFWRKPVRKRVGWSLRAFRYVEKAARPEFYAKTRELETQ